MEEKDVSKLSEITPTAYIEMKINHTIQTKKPYVTDVLKIG